MFHYLGKVFAVQTVSVKVDVVGGEALDAVEVGEGFAVGGAFRVG